MGRLFEKSPCLSYISFDKTWKDAHIVLTKIYRLQLHKKYPVKTVMIFDVYIDIATFSTEMGKRKFPNISEIILNRIRISCQLLYRSNEPGRIFFPEKCCSSVVFDKLRQQCSSNSKVKKIYTTYRIYTCVYTSLMQTIWNFRRAFQFFSTCVTRPLVRDWFLYPYPDAYIFNMSISIPRGG